MGARGRSWRDEEDRVIWVYKIQDTPGYGDDLNVDRSISNLVRHDASSLGQRATWPSPGGLHVELRLCGWPPQLGVAGATPGCTQQPPTCVHTHLPPLVGVC